jgi:glycosyltransferase involved in cell wall biosynthesis
MDAGDLEPRAAARLSVCMATFNGARFLPAQIDSILGQLGPQDELVVSDDGSTDRTPEILAGYGDRLRVVGTSRVGGVVPNFERALAAARGDLVALSDQDDVWLDGRAALIRERLGGATLVAMNGVVVDEALKPLGRTVFQQVGVPGGFLRTLAVNRYVGCCMAFRRELLAAALPFPPRIAAHDWFIALVAERLFDVANDDRPLFLFRRHGGNASTTGGRSRHGLGARLAMRWRMLRAVARVELRLSR